MAELPSGTVTLLFADVEGSTALVRELGEAWAEVLQRQRELCRQAWAAHEGHELGTEGDSFFVAFATADQAVTAAVDAQRALAAQPWPGTTPLRVRIGIHTGSPMRTGEGYVGLDVHRAARVSAAAHGGQVLVSEATLALLTDGRDHQDLGEHALKDIPHRIRLHQVVAPGLERSFPPVRTQGGAGSLPTLMTPTVGRQGELAELRALLVDEGVRLVTLTGPGGTGKTRLATALAGEVAEAYPDGVFFVPLESATTGPEMWSGMAQVLDVPADGQVPPGFFDYVGHRRVLLVLDNLEQIADADAVCRELLVSAPHVSVVATCRRPLHVEGEHDHAVPPLLLPPDDGSTFEEIAASGAVQMFVDHARRAKRTFELTPDNAADVAGLCAALDGLPLALEVVAARVRMLSPKALLVRIDQALDLATSDRSRADRQRTLRGAIEWSYQLLDGPHRTTLDHLGVFDGGADLEALGAVVPPERLEGQDLVDVLFDLTEASLVRAQETDDGEPRFTLLETVRRFALDQLGRQGTLDAALARHGQHFYDKARALFEASIPGSPSFLADVDNFDAVLERGAVGITDPDWYDGEVPPRHVAALLIAAADDAGRIHSVLAWSRLALGWTHLPDDDLGVSAVTGRLAEALVDTGRPRDSLALLGEVSRPQPAGDRPLPEWVDPAVQVIFHLHTTMQAWFECDESEQAAPAIAELEQLDPPTRRARRWSHIAQFLYTYSSGDFERALAILEAESIWDDPARTANNLADVELQLGRRRAAQARLAEAAVAASELTDPKLLIIYAATFAATVGPEQPLLCARVYSAYERARVVEAFPDTPAGEEEDARVLAEIRALVSPEEWDAAWAQGATENLPDLILEMAALPSLSSE